MRIKTKNKILRLNKQKGIALPIALIVLIGILLASANLMRSSEVSINVSGNISARAAAGNANDTAMAAALAWLAANQGNLDNDRPADGYRSAYPATEVDYTKEDSWAQAQVLPVDSLGNVSSYKIVRMCDQPNTPYNGSNAGTQNVCALSNSGSGAANTSSSVGYDAVNFEGTSGVKVHYQIYVRTIGPKDARVITMSVVAMAA